MAVKLETRENVIVARLEGEIDHHTARELREEIDEAVEQARPRELVLDFGEVSFMDSSGIGLILGRFRMMRLFSGKLSVTGADPRIRTMMKLAGIEKIVDSG